jgi:lysophospholipase L1-like esterase
LPEAPGFTRPGPTAASEAYLARLGADLGLPLIDARDWVSTAELPDGFHLTQAGAAALTKRLAPAIDAVFPELAR